MDEFIKVSAKTVEDAILEASIQLGTSSDNIEYHILERETKGFLGIGAKKALIEARRKISEEDIINEVFYEKKTEPEKKKEAEPAKKAAKKTEKTEKKQGKETQKAGKKEEKTAVKAEKTAKKADKADKAEKAEKPQKPARAEKAEKPQKAEKTAKPAKTENPEKEVPAENAVKEEKAKQVQEPSGETVPRVPADPETVKSRAQEFLTQMLKAMGVEASIETEYEDGTLNVNLNGDDMGILIGKRGQTLDSIQYLTSLVVNKGKASYVRVKIDTENYRERRKATLENLAKNMAFKAKKTRRPAYLEPMNPYERRIIHSALQNDPYVTTHSEGDEPARKVVITLRRHEKEEITEE